MAHPTTALALAGGGMKGAFETGALQYLIEETGLVPDIITGVSAGAIIGVVLAQARTPQEFVRRCQELRANVLAMTRNDLVFGRQPWMAALEGTPLGATVDHLVVGRNRPPLPGLIVDDDPTASSNGTGTVDRVDPDGASKAHPPVRGRAAQLLELATRSMRSIPALVRSRHELRSGSNSFMTLDPLESAMRGEDGGARGISAVDPSLIGRPGLKARFGIAALNAGVLRYVTESGHLVESDAMTPVAGRGSGPVDLIDATLSSASVPIIFPPRPMADDCYVDGGVLQNIPVSPALALGAERVIAIVAVPLKPPPVDRDFTTASLGAVYLRTSTEMAFRERQLNDLAVPLPDGATLTVIDPTLDLVGPFEASAGLMQIDMDYGWLRAADLLSGADEQTRRRVERGTEALVIARTHAWHLERKLGGSRYPNNAEIRHLRQLKDQVHDCLKARRGRGLPTPPQADEWWSTLERHEPDPGPELQAVFRS